MQDKAKGLQAKHVERINWPMQTTSCVYFPKDTIKMQRSMHEEVRGNEVIKRKYLCCEACLCKASSIKYIGIRTVQLLRNTSRDLRHVAQ